MQDRWSVSSEAVAAVAAMVLTLGLMPPSPVSACACCGGWSSNVPIGWSASGNSLLVERTSQELCQVSVALEVWRRRQAAPAVCFDLQRERERPVSCDALTRRDRQAVRVSRRAAFYPREARVVPPDRVRVTALPPRHGSTVGLARRARVEVRADGRWRRVWSGDVFFAHSEDGPHDAHFDIWPSPTSNQALLRIQDLDPTQTAHGYTHGGVRMIWITLPQEVAAAARPVTRARPVALHRFD